MDKRKIRNSSWDNLKKGPGAASKKAYDNQKFNRCLTCQKKFKVTQCSKNRKFCNQKCKNKGQSIGLTAPMRKGTGASLEICRIKKKYWRYRRRDGKLDYTPDEFVDRISKGVCIYCGSNNFASLGLDRIDNSKPHLLANTNICCELCNTTKGHRYTVKQMKLLGEVIKTFNMDGWRMMNKKSLLKMNETINNK